MSLETMEPNPVWTKEAYADEVDILASLRDEVTYKVWGGDWCIDCRSQLPDFAAALEAAGVPDSRIEHYPVEKEEDGSKTGPGVEEHGIELIPTVVVERDAQGASTGASGDEPRARDGEEVARFVEEAQVSIAVYLARELEALAASA
ncbi:thiol reductase thioredoxin [Halobacteriales archaeon QS_4_69_31]|nr:MAG: thiol reductase thioredoxin [Halobacteriales archaeon QS_4_69_31]